MVLFRMFVFFLFSLVSLEGFSKVEVAGVGTLGKEKAKYIKDQSVWQGIDLDQGKYKIVMTTASVTEVDLAEDQIGFRIEFTPDVAFATRGLNLKAGDIVPSAIVTSPIPIDPLNAPKEFSIGSMKVKISGTISLSLAEYKKRGDLNYGSDGEPNYKIVIKTQKESVTFTPPVDKYAINEVMWLGDLNSDGFPDVLLQSQAGMLYPQVLLVSRRTGKTVVMEVIGEIPGAAGVFRGRTSPK